MAEQQVQRDQYNKVAAEHIANLVKTAEIYRSGYVSLDNWSVEGFEALLAYMTEFAAGKIPGPPEDNAHLRNMNLTMTNEFLSLMKMVYLKMMREDFANIAPEELECEILVGARVNALEQLVYESEESDEYNNKMLLYRMLHLYIEMIDDYFANDLARGLVKATEELAVQVSDEMLHSLSLEANDPSKLILSSLLIEHDYLIAHAPTFDPMHMLCTKIAILKGGELSDADKEVVSATYERLKAQIQQLTTSLKDKHEYAIRAINQRIEMFNEMSARRGIAGIEKVQADLDETYGVSPVGTFIYQPKGA